MLIFDFTKYDGDLDRFMSMNILMVCKVYFTMLTSHYR